MTENINQRIEQLLEQHSVLLFMKGSPQSPMCGFSANTVKIIKELLNDDFSYFNVLEDNEMREGIKVYGQWPTIPQLYINKELIGGNDIITEMYHTGELQDLLGLEKPEKNPPQISISEKAKQHIKESLQNVENDKLFLSIDEEFNTQFSLEIPKGYEIICQFEGFNIYMNIGTAKRAEGIEIAWVDELEGSGLRIKNPNEPPQVNQISVQQYRQWLSSDKENPKVYDVRTEENFKQGTVDSATRLDNEAIAEIEKMPKDTALLFVCQIGQSSMGAAEFFRKKGFTNIYNLIGGYNAWNNKQ